MPDYRHDRILDEAYFFTVNLLERRMDLPNAYIGVLREARAMRFTSFTTSYASSKTSH